MTLQEQLTEVAYQLSDRADHVCEKGCRNPNVWHREQNEKLESGEWIWYEPEGPDTIYVFYVSEPDDELQALFDKADSLKKRIDNGEES